MMATLPSGKIKIVVLETKLSYPRTNSFIEMRQSPIVWMPMIKPDVPLNLIEDAYPNGGRDIDGLLWTLQLFIYSSWKSEQHKVYVNIDMWQRQNIYSDISKTHDTIKSKHG